MVLRVDLDRGLVCEPVYLALFCQGEGVLMEYNTHPQLAEQDIRLG